MAKEMLGRGYDVTILAHEHQGYHGIPVTNDYEILNHEWDLIIVHGADVISQNIALVNAHQIKSPILYMIIKPSDSLTAINGMKDCAYIGYSTYNDVYHIQRHNHQDKARRVRHGIVVDDWNDHEFVYTPKKMVDPEMISVVSVGGFSPHKGMNELADTFNKHRIPGMRLYLSGYMDQRLAPQESDYVRVFKYLTRSEARDLINQADVYVMNSYEEGFGLVLLEAMLAKVPWIARSGVGAVNDLGRYGTVVNNAEGIMYALEQFKNTRVFSDVDEAREYVLQNHMIRHTCDDIEDILWNG